MEKFADFLKNQRKKSGMTQESLASSLEVSGAYIHQLESGKMVPPTENRCRQLADALGVSFEHIWELARRERIINIASREGVVDAIEKMASDEIILSEDEKALVGLLRMMDSQTRKDFNGLVMMLLRHHTDANLKLKLEEYLKKCA